MGVDKETLKTIVEEAMPFFKHIGLKLKEVTRDSVTLSLPFNEWTKNHVGTHYAASIFTVAEACGGAIFALKADVTKYLIILKGFNIRFTRPATGEIHCTLSVPDGEMEEILKKTEENGKYDWEVDMEVKDEKNEVIARCKGIYHIRKLY